METLLARPASGRREADERKGEEGKVGVRGGEQECNKASNKLARTPLCMQTHTITLKSTTS